jgi:carboxylate-amine ligase
MSYRQAAYDEWPRTGIPDHFRDEAEYARFVELLAAGGAAQDASFLWWAIRPALRYPTLELRICDVCTRVADAVAIASLYRCLVSRMVRRPEAAAAWTPFTRRLIDENRWRAKRSGLEAEFLTLDGQPPVACRTVVLDLLDAVAEDASRLDCEPALARIRRLLDEGTSAHVQIKLFEQRRAQGDSVTQAMQYVVDWLVAATYAGTDHAAIAPSA